jgi:hypothetical protein
LINKAINAMFISLLASVVCFILYFSKTITPLICFSVLLAIAISSVNFLSFVVIYLYSVKKSNKVFLICNLGGMSLRLLLVPILVLISIKFLKIALVEFIFTFFIWYILLLMFEIMIINKNLKTRKT